MSSGVSLEGRRVTCRHGSLRLGREAGVAGLLLAVYEPVPVLDDVAHDTTAVRPLGEEVGRRPGRLARRTAVIRRSRGSFAGCIKPSHPAPDHRQLLALPAPNPPGPCTHALPQERTPPGLAAAPDRVLHPMQPALPRTDAPVCRTFRRVASHPRGPNALLTGVGASGVPTWSAVHAPVHILCTSQRVLEGTSEIRRYRKAPGR